VIKNVIISSIKIFLALPGSIAALGGLRKIAEETGFDKSSPDNYAELLQWINTLLYILTEHWIAWILLSIFGGMIWAFLVVEPKAAALKEFKQARKKRIGE
jgi:hypothetical protein